MDTRGVTRSADALGVLGLPEPVSALAARAWDVVVIGAGHNGLCCAFYLARAGRRVLVVEARPRVGGACTLEETWPGYRVSPCAYLVGLLHPLVLKELELVARGLAWTVPEAGLFVPFDDGESIQLWDDEDRCRAEVERVAPGDVAGWNAMKDVKRRLREALRPGGNGDLWVGRAPSQEQIEKRLRGDRDALKMLFEWSMAEYVERFVHSERLQMAYLGQGVIGTNASPLDPGTASIHFHHQSGRLNGVPGAWGYVRGGMGTVSFLICDAAREAGAVIACGLPVARIEPGRGVELEGGEWLEAPCLVSNADPKTTLRLLGDAADQAWRTRVEAIPMVGCTVKLNLALSELPNFRARRGALGAHHYGQVNTPLSKTEWHESHRKARAGGLPERVWTELYFQTAHDPTVAPPGLHTMSVFSQYVPYAFAEGDWNSRRDEVGRVVLGAIARHCTNFPDAVLEMQVLGPPDIERTVGLSGGHIFQGECLPAFMWDRRLEPRTPMPGLFLCGACTHPGGSVIGVNGRNAAMEILGIA
jgi:phytoene dehydrogenase-like protein